MIGTSILKRATLLEVLRFEAEEGVTKTLRITRLLRSLRSRRDSVEAGLEVDGVKMQGPKKLVIHLELLTSEQLVEYKDLAEEVVDWKSEPGFFFGGGQDLRSSLIGE